MASSRLETIAAAGGSELPVAFRPARRAGFMRLFVRNRIALVGLVLVLLFAALSALGPLLMPYDPYLPELALRLQGPSLAHPFGTDEVGRDILTRIAYGARFSLLMGVVAMSIAACIGVPLGLQAGYRSGWSDIAIMRGVDVMMTLPSIVLAIAIVSVLGAGVTSVVIAVGITSTPAFARLTRAVALTLREQDFVAAARVVGASDLRILRRHILPNSLPPIIVQASLGVGTTILTASALGFLGLGVEPPTPEWGAMLSRGRSYVSVAPNLVVFPGLAIALLVLGFNLLGDGLRDALDPRMKQMTR